MRNFTIRPAKLADPGALCELYHQLNPHDPPWPSETAALDALASVLKHAGTTILICEVGSTCVSTCMLVVCPVFFEVRAPICAHRKCCDAPRAGRVMVEVSFNARSRPPVNGDATA